MILHICINYCWIFKWILIKFWLVLPFHSNYLKLHICFKSWTTTELQTLWLKIIEVYFIVTVKLEVRNPGVNRIFYFWGFWPNVLCFFLSSSQKLWVLLIEYMHQCHLHLSNLFIDSFPHFLVPLFVYLAITYCSLVRILFKFKKYHFLFSYLSSNYCIWNYLISKLGYIYCQIDFNNDSSMIIIWISVLIIIIIIKIDRKFWHEMSSFEEFI